MRSLITRLAIVLVGIGLATPATAKPVQLRQTKPVIRQSMTKQYPYYSDRPARWEVRLRQPRSRHERGFEARTTFSRRLTMADGSFMGQAVYPVKIQGVINLKNGRIRILSDDGPGKY